MSADRTLPDDLPDDLPGQEAESPDDELPLLEAPRGGLPPVVVDPAGLSAATEALRAGPGPIAVDAERAHGFRYSPRAYLIQLRRAGAGTRLIDPIALQPPGTGADAPTADLSGLSAAIDDAEWIIHAASQDLPCLAEIGMLPRTLFDTELAGRLLGYPRVALGTLVQECLGVRLLKEHSAADWSTRPLPEAWLVYAALDVELLLELRDVLAGQLEEAGKAEWARQEFAWLAERAGVPVEPREDPWRRTSGLHTIRSGAGLALVRQLWEVRDAIAQAADRAPGRILPDRAISALAEQVSNDGHSWPDPAALRHADGFNRRHGRAHERDWQAALHAAQRLPRSEWPPVRTTPVGPPPPRTWANRDPAAAARLTRARTFVTQTSERLKLPAENLITPDTVRRLAWQPPTKVTAEAVDAFLAEAGIRPWQRELCVDGLTAAVRDDAPPAEDGPVEDTQVDALTDPVGRLAPVVTGQ